MLWNYKMKYRPLKIIIFLIVAIFLLSSVSSGSQENCIQDCLECQEIVMDSCCQNSMAEKTPPPSHSSPNNCDHGQFCTTTKEHTKLLANGPLQSPTSPSATLAFFAIEPHLNTSNVVPETSYPAHRIYTDIQLHILHCSFII